MNGAQNFNDDWRRKAMRLVQEGRIEEALLAFEEAIRLEPDDALLWNAMGDALVQLSRYEEALVPFENAVRLDPKNAAPRSGKGTALYKLERFAEALTDFEQAVRLAPGDAVSWRRKGVILCELGRLEEGLMACEEAIRLDPDDNTAWGNKGDILHNLERYEDAVAAFDEAIRLAPDDVPAWNNKGVALIKLGRFEEALITFNATIRLDSDNVEAWNNKGNTLCNLMRDTDALAAFGEAIRIAPDCAFGWVGKGDTLCRLGRHDEALPAYDEAIRLDPDLAVPWNGKGKALSCLGRYQEALAAYKEATHLDPNDAGHSYGRGTALFELARHKKALAAFEEALRLAPGLVVAWSWKGRTLYELGRHEEALAAFDEAIRLDPPYASPWYGKGHALGKLGRREEALRAYVEAIRLDPDSIPAWDGKGKALYRLNRYEEALAAFEEAIRLGPNMAALWDGKGSALCELGRAEDGLLAFDEAIRLDPDGFSQWIGKGNALCELGRAEEGLPAFDEAIRLDPGGFSQWNGRGNALSELGRKEEALLAFEEAIRLNPSGAYQWNGKGNALYALGRHEQALHALEEAIRLEPKSALSWINMAHLLREHADLRRRSPDRDYQQCLRRGILLAYPPRSVKDLRNLRRATLTIAEDGGMGLLLERLVQQVLPDGVLLTAESLLRQISQETAVAHTVFAWLQDPTCLLQGIESLRLRGQVLLRFGDPIKAREVLDKLDDTTEGEHDLGGQLYLVWSLREYLEPHDKELDFAYNQGQRWIWGDWGSPDEMTCYYAGHIALLKNNLKMAREAFERAGHHLAALLMAWQTARLMKDNPGADSLLSLLLAEERKALRLGLSGILLPEVLTPFDPNTAEGQDALQLVLRRFEVSGALMDLLATVDLRKHPGYQALRGDFEERTGVLTDFEQYERAVQTWRVKEEVKQRLERQLTTTIRQSAEKEMYASAADFTILDVAPPCSLRDDQLVERLAQSLFQRNLAGQGEHVMNVILSMLRQGRLKSEQAVLLIMYACAKAHHDHGAAAAVRAGKFAARTTLEAMILYLVRHCGVSFVESVIATIGGWGLCRKLVDVVEVVIGELRIGRSDTFPTYPEFTRHMHRHWAESGDGKGLLEFLP